MPDHVLNMVARAYAIVEVGGISGIGPERGRRFEQLFYKMCEKLGVRLTEKAGSRSIAGQRSTSGLAHEVDGASRAAVATTHWELKHLSTALEKNELLIFNSKGLDYFYDAGPLFQHAPLYRFLLSGNNIRDDSRVFAVQWGITVIEPGRFIIPLIYEAVARGFRQSITQPDQEAVYSLAPWAFRPLQAVIQDLAARCNSREPVRPSFSVARRAKEAIDMQEQVGIDVLDELEDEYPDWVNNLAHQVWNEIGGWR
jgi:hypothetical protein